MGLTEFKSQISQSTLQSRERALQARKMVLAIDPGHRLAFGHPRPGLTETALQA
jgi:hypothetical protein